MKKNLKVGLYNPYLDIMGGGEKHILSILKVLEDEGFEINIFWDKDLNQEIVDKFSLVFSDRLKFLPNIFKSNSFPLSALQTLRTLKNFDLFFYVTDGSYFFSSANKNYIFCMVPQRELFTTNLLNKLKLLNYRFISNSQFTGNKLLEWGINNQYIHPYIDKAFFANPSKKKPIILSVGRFFTHLHAKKQEMIIDTFIQLKKNRQFVDYQLHLAGSVKKEDDKYVRVLKNKIKTHPDIHIDTNLPFEKLLRIYKEAEFYWHFTGYGIDEKKHPEMVEHFGITPLEAMASGCIVFCYNAGGPKKLIINGRNGYLFNDRQELLNQMQSLIRDEDKKSAIRDFSRTYVNANFSYSVFKDRVRKIII
ncbi:MAG: Glycosyl transferase family 2 [Candidatus Roizmanbacteria bacterium GW2011_GWA2_36_23]|uniref:Glycosyl transferase family 2 n=1 Tax=Candidatus Roizmanbacteria bacterium GW2011_GWA2_36_23 TaxID=1618480 RepID=A0A0G0HDG0_9BACT|nr:MAG: Glycosyl transferase family 2 [Candidatus Roizmanbacteria bacterium GW2011_GWA2_36_23]